MREGATHLLDGAHHLCILVLEQLDPRGPRRLGVAHVGAAGSHRPGEHHYGVPTHCSKNCQIAETIDKIREECNYNAR